MWLERGLSAHTQAAYRRDLSALAGFFPEADLVSLNSQQLSDYLAELHRRKQANSSVSRLLSCLRGFYRYQLRRGVIDVDPLALIVGPKAVKRLPITISEQQVGRLLAAPDTAELIGLRDKAMLELLYSSGLRVSELIGLTLSMVNVSMAAIKVVGKGGKERLLPVGEEAMHWLQLYCREARGTMLAGKGAEVVFPSARGRQMTRQTFWYRVKHYAVLAGIEGELSPHTLRHAFATHLLNHGADLRVLQTLLGHSDLSTTQIYTHVAKARMQRLHQQHHPRG